MKRIALTLAAIVASTAAYADKSDRYNDLRLDTSIVKQIDYTDRGNIASTRIAKPAPFTLSSRNGMKKDGGYAYSNPYGVGPNNDSR